MFNKKLQKLLHTLKAIKDDQKGLTSVEYAIVGALISAPLVVAFTDLGDAVAGAIDTLTSMSP
mgnify:FL=1